MEQQVAEATLAMVRPTTDASTRAAASQFLEQWTQTPEAWQVYLTWLHSFDFSGGEASQQEVAGTQLLCLTLLQAKIRREVPLKSNHNPTLQSIQHQLLRLLQDNNVSHVLVKPLCVCTAALAVRCDALQDLVSTSCQSGNKVGLLLLGCIPPEVEACPEYTTPQVTEALWPYMEVVLDTVRRVLSGGSSDTIPTALEVLRNWAQTCHVTLSHLNSPTCGGIEALLPLLIHLLSQPQQSSSDVTVAASRALTEAILIPSDSCTPSREQAVQTMVDAISRGFIAIPFEGDDQDSCHALSTLLGTLVTEEVDHVSAQPCEALLHLLLKLQSHPSIPVTLPILECWLTVQEVPTESRHAHWQAPLFEQVLQGLLERIAYPRNFTTWGEEVDLDPQEFSELRRMVTDVLISCYFLLRIKCLHLLSPTQNEDWSRTEACLYALKCVSREVCARVKARGEAVRADRQATCQHLLVFVKHHVQQPSTTHPLVKRGIASFIGNYAPAWNVQCGSDDLLQLLAYLRTNIMTEEASKATRSLYVACSTKLLSHKTNQALLLQSVHESMNAVLTSTNELSSMAAVAEGSTRLLVQIKDKSVVRQALNSILLVPVMHRADTAAKVAVSQTPDSEAAVVALSHCLHIVQIIIQFCDNPSQNGEAHVLSEAVATLWTFLDKMTTQCRHYEDVLNEILAVHRQLLTTVPGLVAPHSSATVKFVVEAFERMKLPSALEYIAGAVEAFGSDASSAESFQELLRHITTVTVSYVTTEKHPDDCPALIRAFFEMNQRFMFFCPSALIGCQEFPTIVSLAVECLTACQGERESVRATLIFLSQLFGWRSLRLAQNSSDALDAVAGKIDEQLLKHGEAVTRACIDGLSGGPQMLWPAYAECLFAITAHIAGNNAAGPVVEETTVAHSWVFLAMSNVNVRNGEAMKPETCQQIMAILFALSREGQKAKPKAKMLLTDFAKICKGEMSTDALLSYGLQ